MVSVLYPDPQTGGAFVRERQAEYEHAAALQRLAQPLVERRRRQRRRRRERLRLHIASIRDRSGARSRVVEAAATGKEKP
jgi:hypothetical protein